MAWNPDEWQSSCMLLASRFHQGAFQEIFDANGGDGGMEGFAKDGSGAGYQCYVPEPDAVTPVQDRIINKVNTDTLKLQKNRVFFEKCFSNIKLRRLTFLIPQEHLRHKDLAAHTGKREAEVRSWKLPFIADDFCIVIGHGAEFDATREALKAFGKARIDIGDAMATEAELDAWEKANATKIPVLDDKLSRTLRPQSAIRVLRAELIEAAVVAQNNFDRFRREDPDGWLTLTEAKNRKGRALKSESALNSAFPTEFIKKVTDDYKAKVAEVMPAA